MARQLRGKPVVVLIALALIATACSGNGSTDAVAVESTETTEDAEATVAAYVASIEAISADTEELIREAFDSAFAETEGQSFDSLLPEYSGALDGVIAAERDALARVETLDPPEVFVADQERWIVLAMDRIDAVTRQQAAADAGDTELIAQIDIELASMQREGLAGLSPEFGRYFATSDGAVAAAALFGDLSAEETDYLDAVAKGWDEFGRRVRAYSEAVSRSYTSDELLLLALLDAGAGEAFAAVLAVIIEIDPPPSYVDGHAQLLAYLDELVALDTEIAEAAEAGDVVGFEVANYRMVVAGGRFHLAAPPSLVAVNGPTAVLVPPEDLPGGAYGQALWEALKRFQILALSQTISTGVFPITSDDKLAQTIAEVMPTAIKLTEDAVASVDALAPPAEFQAGHDRMLVYLGGLVELRQSILQAAAVGDLDALRTYGELGSFEAERDETELFCAVRADLEGDPIEPITATLFSIEGIPETEICPGR
jgi:hypothetical protein